MSLPQDGFNNRGSSRRKVTVIVALAAFALVAWIYVVLSFGGEGEQTAAEVTSGVTSETSTRGSETGDSEQAVPDGPAYATTPDDQRTSLDNAQVQQDEQQDDQRDQQQLPSYPEDMRASSDAPRGAENEPGSYDPLGTGPDPGDLAQIDEERLRFAAGQFVTAAYGYTGKDRDEYNQGVGKTVVWPVFFHSAGSEEITRYAKQVEQNGTTSAARLTDFEVTNPTPRLSPAMPTSRPARLMGRMAGSPASSAPTAKN